MIMMSIMQMLDKMNNLKQKRAEKVEMKLN